MFWGLRNSFMLFSQLCVCVFYKMIFWKFYTEHGTQYCYSYILFNCKMLCIIDNIFRKYILNNIWKNNCISSFSFLIPKLALKQEEINCYLYFNIESIFFFTVLGNKFFSVKFCIKYYYRGFYFHRRLLHNSNLKTSKNFFKIKTV